MHLTLPALASIRAWSPLVGGAWFYQNQASQSERERLAITSLPAVSGTPSFAFKEDTRYSSELQTSVWLLYVRISGKLVTSGLELNVIINGWIPVEKDFV